MARPSGARAGGGVFRRGSCPDEKLAGVLPATLRADPPPARRATGDPEEQRASCAHLSEEPRRERKAGAKGRSERQERKAGAKAGAKGRSEGRSERQERKAGAKGRSERCGCPAHRLPLPSGERVGVRGRGSRGSSVRPGPAPTRTPERSPPTETTAPDRACAA